MGTLTLAAALGLRPLDRLQINSRHEMAESKAFKGPNDRADKLPFWYFQRVVGDVLEVRSPGGYVTRVAPCDVCDVVQGVSVGVLAMPVEAFIQRSKLRIEERTAEAGAESFAPANVLYGEKDRWGRVDFFVWFLDDALNEKKPWRAPLPATERARINGFARRTVMPIMSRAGANHSADHGLSNVEAYNRRVADLLIRAGLDGRVGDVSHLASAGVKAQSMASLNRLYGRQALL